MIYQILNRLTNEIESFDDAIDHNALATAQAKLDHYTALYLEQEAMRFHIAKIEHNDIGEVWHNLDGNDPAIGDYRVLDQYSGQYTQVASLQEAIDLSNQRKQEFMISLNNKVFEKLTTST